MVEQFRGNGWEVRRRMLSRNVRRVYDSYDNFKRMQFDKFLSGMQPLEDDEEGLILDVSARDNSVFQDISNILGLPYEIKEGGIDMAALKAVQKARWEEE